MYHNIIFKKKKKVQQKNSIFDLFVSEMKRILISLFKRCVQIYEMKNKYKKLIRWTSFIEQKFFIQKYIFNANLVLLMNFPDKTVSVIIINIKMNFGI